MATTFDPLGNEIEVVEDTFKFNSTLSDKKEDDKRYTVDPSGNKVAIVEDKYKGIKFSSTSSNPKKEKEKEGIIEKYVFDPVTAAVAGVGEGAGKLIEGTISLGTLLIDVGVGSDLTSKVEKAFDDNKIMQFLEDKADDAWTGTVTSVLTQFGIPGTAALKVANGLIKARNVGVLAKTMKPGFIGRRPTLFKATLAGGAEAAAATGDMGTLGDLIGGPTKTIDEGESEGRQLAGKRLLNKFKFGVEGALGFTLFDKVVFPVGKKLFTSAVPGFKGLLKDVGINQNVIKNLEFNPTTGKNELVERSINEGFQFNKNNILRWVDKNVLAPFRARGNLPKDVFEANRKKITKLKSITEKVRGETLELEKAVQKVIDPDAGGWYSQLDKVGIRRRERMLEDIYDYLTSGKMKPTRIDPKTGKSIPLALDELRAGSKEFNIPESVLPFVQQIRNSIDEMSESLAGMPGFTMKGGADFQSVVAANVGEYLTRSYKMFGSKVDRGQWINTLKNTPEGQAIMDKARTYIKNNNKDMADDLVEAELQGLLKETDKEIVGDMVMRISKYDDALRKTRSQVPGELRELLGEIKDPIKQYYAAAAKINTYIEDTNFFNTLLKKGKDKYFFEGPKDVKGEITKTVPTGEGGLEFGRTIISDGPLNGYRTTPEIAEALNKMTSTKGNEDSLAQLYYKVFLAPKAWTQEAKTTLSPITHARNLISAASFTGMNGNFFRNPMRVAEDFKEAWKMTSAVSKNQLESTMGRELFKDDTAYQAFKNEYRELQELGVVNTSVRLGELAKSLDEVSSGLQNLSETGKIYTMMRGWGDKTGFNKLRNVARTAYQAEDDIYKIQNYYSERSKYTDALGKTFRDNPKKFIDEMGDEIARVNPTLTKEEALADLLKPNGFERFIKLKAADTVKNNIPNYDYIGSFGQTLRRLPIGNFVSFPLEIIRTGINTTRQGLKEVMNPMTRGIGLGRLGGVATFGLGLGKGLQEGAQLVSGVSNEQLNALREYLPEWSQDSSLIPIKQGDQLYYIDFSHTNAYDTLTLPFRAAINGFGAAREEGQSILGSFDDAAWRAATKFASPFVEESIATKFMADVALRGGQSKEGRRIWNPEDDMGTKVSKTLAELFRTASPGSLKQFYRIYLSGTGSLDQYNRGYKFLNESTGLLGFRIQNPFIEQGINFKISDNKRAVANSKKIFTSIAYRADATADEIMEAYSKANESKIRNDKLLFKQIKAAQELGMNNREIRKIMGERYSGVEANNLMRNKFTPIKISDFAYQKMRENSKERGLGDISRLIRKQANRMYRSLFNNILIENPSEMFKDTFNLIEGESLTTSPRTEDAQSLAEMFTSEAPTVPQVPRVPLMDPFGNQINTGSLINPSDVSQLAKSGDIDITEAIAARRT
jgi:DNA-binding transcriptional MerR regulator